MNEPTISDYLKYANLQMAAEAFIRDERTGVLNESGQRLIDALTAGNGHHSRFTESEAVKFAAKWVVIDQRANTGTGFSGTLFRNTDTDELVLSFRSTEFIDDAIRDHASTNALEIRDTGWAWGQLDDMERWYGELSADGGALDNRDFSVTGYSLGGHLATAFNLLHPGAAQQVVTFNGAGVGKLRSGTLGEALSYFRDLRDHPERIKGELAITTPRLASLYDQIRRRLDDRSWSAAQALAAVDALTLAGTPHDEIDRAILAREKAPLVTALREIIDLEEEAGRIAPFTAGGDGADAGTSPRRVPAAEILAQSLDYRLAVSLAARRSFSATLLGGGIRAISGKEYGEPLAGNQFDLVGSETTTPAWSAVANSQWHHGAHVPLFIEDQPFVRGSILSESAKASLDYGDTKLLVDHYALNNFADNHSLVLIIDSLGVQNVLLQLLPEAQRSAATAPFERILRQASWHRAESSGGTQGKAEGDVLENVVNSLADLLLGPQTLDKRLEGSLEGNTWAKIEDPAGHAGRTTLYARLDAITGSDAYRALVGQLGLTTTEVGLPQRARSDFATFAALYSLSPFVFSSTDSEGLEGALRGAWGSLYDLWAADRDALAAGQDAASLNISESWLHDRAEFLQRALWFNANNKKPEQPVLDPGKDGHPYQQDATSFEDAFSAYRIAQGFSPDDPPSSIQRHYFGDGRANRVSGGGVADRLYGGGGNDLLEGKDGADHLEGNADDDTLGGGQGNDTLDGGSGFDTYLIEADGGFDILRDSDGSGRIRIGEQTLGLADWVADGLWQRDGITYRLRHRADAADDLVISSPAGITSLENYRPGALGLILAAAPEAEPAEPTTREILGDFHPLDRYPDLPGVQYAYDELGNFIPDLGQPDPGHADTLKDSNESDHIDAGGGNDLIAARRGGADWIELGAGDDWADGGAGADRIAGGAGRDILEGSDDDDTLEGGDDPDLLGGGSGDDFLYARAALALAAAEPAAAGDLLDGGDGDDRLFAGAGDDLLDSGAGDDIAAGEAGNDQIDGGAGADILSGDRLDDPDRPADGLAGVLHGSDHLDGGDGDDQIAGNGNDDVLLGAAGNDEVHGDDPRTPGEHHGDDRLDGGDGQDELWGEGADDALSGGAGDDYLDGDSLTLDTRHHGEDTLDGGDGNDDLIGGAGDDRLFGGQGDDHLAADDIPTVPLPATVHGNDFLDGGEGEDSLRGGGGKDTLVGAGGADQLSGEADDDWLDGGSGDDVLRGGEGADTLVGGSGTEYLTGGAGDDRYFFAGGDGPLDDNGGGEIVVDGEGSNTIVFSDATPDQLQVGNSAATLVIDYGPSDRLGIDHGVVGSVQQYAFANGETLSHSELIGRLAETPISASGGGSHFFLGGRRDDHLIAGAGHGILSGGRGNDILAGSGGDNTYLYSLGDGSDRISDSGNATLRFGAGITPDDLELGLGSLRIKVGKRPDDVIHIEGFDPEDALGGRPAIGRFAFADGTVLDYAELLEKGFAIAGTAGNDTLAGSSVGDRLDGGAGNDHLRGGGGSDTYRWGIGSGQDSIDNSDSSTGKTDTLEIGDGLLAQDLILARSGDDLIIRLRAIDDRLRVLGHYAAAPIDRIRLADGTTWDRRAIDAHLEQALSDDDDIYTGTPGNDRLDARAGNDLVDGLAGDDEIEGGAGDDTLSGGPGDDRMNGGSDSDTYRFARGDGADLVTDHDTSPGKLDTLHFTDLDAAEVTDILRQNDDLVIQFETGEQVTVSHQFRAAADEIERFRFRDGVVRDAAGIRAGITAVGGTPGNDVITGSPDAPNRIFGREGNDQLRGGARSDWLDGGPGYDRLDGLAGADTLVGGPGNDTFVVDDPGDLVLENPGEGDDTLETSISFALSAGGAHVETLRLLGSSPLTGSGDDLANTLVGNSAPNALSGGAGDDTLHGLKGKDTLDGGRGNDTLDGGEGDDSYFFDRGSGNDRLVDDALPSDNDFDRVKLGDGITAADLTVSALANRSWLLSLAGTTDTLELVADSRLDYSTGQPVIPIERIAFADGTVVHVYTERLLGTAAADNLHFDAHISGTDYLPINVRIDGGAGNDTIRGGPGNDVLRGGPGSDLVFGDVFHGAGNDEIYGDDGDDTLYGGSSTFGRQGSDRLDGGPGNDVLYGAGSVRYGRGYGQDRVIARADRLELFDLLPEDIDLQYRADGLYFQVRESRDWLKLETGEARIALDRVTFADGSSWDRRAIETRVIAQGGGNLAPEADVPLPSLAVAKGQAFSFVLPENAFRDPNPGDLLSWTVDVPGWLRFDPATRTLSGTPEDQDAGNYSLQVAVHDSGGARASQFLALTVEASNHAPEVQRRPPPLVVEAGRALDWRLPADTFIDRDAGDSLSLTALPASGAAWPTWLAFDGGSATFSGTPPVGEAGELELRIVASDRSGATAETAFTLSIAAAATDPADPAGHVGTPGNDALTGGAGDDWLSGLAGKDTLDGGDGNDLLEGGEGHDLLADSRGRTLFASGAGNDTLSGGDGGGLYLGGQGKDTLRTGPGNDIILHNRGDTNDTLAAGGAGQDILSLGGGIAYADLSFSKANQDLVVSFGGYDRITLQDWYAAAPERVSRSIVRLQVIAEAMADFAPGGPDPLRDQKVESFDFTALVAAFDAARSATPTLTRWALSEALGRCQLAGSDSEAFGGDLAYQYGRRRSLAGIGVTPAIAVLTDPAFGNAPQGLTPPAGLSAGAQRLA